jgi:hypothetical protein
VVVSPTHVPNFWCDQSHIEKLLNSNWVNPVVPELKYITPRTPLIPFYQWESNNGYCGEVSMIQSGMNNGQWISQFDARLLGGSGLNQSGVDDFCSAHHHSSNYNAQLLLEDMALTNVSTMLQNFRLQFTLFDEATQVAGKMGYQNFISWVKTELIKGNQITIGVFMKGGSDTIYDHIVSVVQMRTYHDPTDPTYYADDVIVFDDHGVYTSTYDSFTNNPAIPPGANDSSCTPYLFSYKVGDWVNNRSQANMKGAYAYTILLPGETVKTHAGGDGTHLNPTPIVAHNLGVSVSGVEDDEGVTFPCVLSILKSNTTNAITNPTDPISGLNYENPYIGNSDRGLGCTNDQPAPMTVTFSLLISSLQSEVCYNLYLYRFWEYTGIGNQPLAIPTSNFNAQSSLASNIIQFTAHNNTFVYEFDGESDEIIVSRVVRCDAP